MKTIILSIVLLSIFTISHAQTYNECSGLELSENLNLTNEQKIKIKMLNQGLGKQFEAIGRNRTLSGQEKGRRKQELALKHKREVLNIFTPEQRLIWNNNYDKKNKGIKDSLTDALDDRLSALEDNYETEKKAIEKNKSLSKAQKERIKETLKTKFKSEKEHLKNEKKNIENSVLLNE